MLSSEQVKILSAEQLAWALCLEIPFHDVRRWIKLVGVARETDPKKLELALGLISMDEKNEENVIWALNTSCLNRNYLWKAKEDGTRKVRELAERILFGERYPEFWI